MKRLLISILLLVFALPLTTSATTFNPAANTDTAYYYHTNALVRDGAEGVIGATSDPDTSDGAARFLSVSIPKGSTINSATIALIGTRTRSGSTIASIKGQAADNAATFTLTVADWTARSQTTASVAWTLPSETNGSTMTTPDISSVIQEIVNRSGWSSGNALVVFINDNGSSDFRGYNEFSAGSSWPVLTVTWTPPSSASPSVYSYAFWW